MNIIIFLVILFFSFYKISNMKNNKIIDTKIILSYKNYPIIYENIETSIIDNIILIVNKIYSDNELYKYNYDILDNIINEIEIDYINKSKVKLLTLEEKKIIESFERELFNIRYRCKVKCNSYYKNINRNKCLIKIEKIKNTDK